VTDPSVLRAQYSVAPDGRFLMNTRVDDTALRKARRSSITGRYKATRRSVMPVRSLNSSVLVWPDRATVDRAVRAWAASIGLGRHDVQRIGYFGSYARGDWGVGSDLDLIAVVTTADEAFESRTVHWPLEALPVPAEMLVYTADEYQRLVARGDRFADMIRRSVVWVYPSTV
jgi:hypothetical protein